MIFQTLAELLLYVFLLSLLGFLSFAFSQIFTHQDFNSSKMASLLAELCFLLFQCKNVLNKAFSFESNYLKQYSTKILCLHEYFYPFSSKMKLFRIFDQN